MSLTRSTGRLPSQVRLDHRGLPHDRLWRPFRNLAAFIDHDDAVGQRQDGPHYMLDDERAEADFFLEAGEEPHRFPEFVRRETGEHRVAEEGPGTRRDDPGEL